MSGEDQPDAGVQAGVHTEGSDEDEYRGVTDPEDLRARLVSRDGYLEELSAEAGRLRLAADEARASLQAGEERVRALEEERSALREKVRAYEEEKHAGRRRREGRDQEVERLRRALERRDEEKSRLRDLLEEAEKELRDRDREYREDLRRRDALLEEARRASEKLERELQERETRVAELQASLEGEREAHRRLAEPENRLRAGVKAFNGSRHRKAVSKLTAFSGQPVVRVTLEDGEKAPVLLTFAWPGGDWRTYAARPGSPVEEPRVYLLESGGGVEKVAPENANARLGGRGRVSLGV